MSFALRLQLGWLIVVLLLQLDYMLSEVSPNAFQQMVVAVLALFPAFGYGFAGLVLDSRFRVKASPRR